MTNSNQTILDIINQTIFNTLHAQIDGLHDFNIFTAAETGSTPMTSFMQGDDIFYLTFQCPSTITFDPDATYDDSLLISIANKIAPILNDDFALANLRFSQMTGLRYNMRPDCPKIPFIQLTLTEIDQPDLHFYLIPNFLKA
jgi:hypothetical protein